MTAIGVRAAMLSAVLAAGVIAVQASVPAAESLPPRSPLAQLPPRLGRWHAAGDVAIEEASLKVLNADDWVSREYVDGAVTADLFIAYYRTQRQGGTMHSPLNCLPAAGWQPVTEEIVQIDAQPAAVTANRVIVQKGLDRAMAVYWYQSHGRTVASEYASKAYLVLDSIRLHRSDAALVRVVTAAGDGTAATNFVRALRPVLQRYIPD